MDPSIDQITEALASYNWIYLDEGEDGGVFDADLIQLEEKGDELFDVKLRVFSYWNEVGTAMGSAVCAYDFHFLMRFVKEAKKWEVIQELEDPTEATLRDLADFDDFEAKAAKIVARDYDGWDTEDFADLDMAGVPEILRPSLLRYIAEKISQD
jgi:hypothetical protein